MGTFQVIYMGIPDLKKPGSWEARCGDNAVANYDTPKAAIGGLLNFISRDGTYDIQFNELKTGNHFKVMLVVEGDSITVVKLSKE